MAADRPIEIVPGATLRLITPWKGTIQPYWRLVLDVRDELIEIQAAPQDALLEQIVPKEPPEGLVQVLQRDQIDQRWGNDLRPKMLAIVMQEKREHG